MSAGRSWVRYGTTSLEIPDAPFVLDPVPLVPRAASRMAQRAVGAALDRALASPGLGEIAHGARSVLVVVSDATRATGTRIFLPLLVERIRSAGRATVTFIVASGIHRPPTDEEIESIVGPEIVRSHAVLRHDPDDAGALVELGKTTGGTLVRVHRALREHDRIVVTGAAGFHYYAGFSGGRKGIVPGLAARETVASNHLRSLTASGARAARACAGCLRGNPVHRDMTEGAALLPAHFLVNTVLREDGTLERLFAGHWRRAHEAACRYLLATRRVRVEPRDLVVVSAGGEPSDINLIQSHKAFETAVACVRRGGVVVLLARCRQGAGHPDFLPWFRFANEAEHVAALKSNFEVYGQTALSWRRKTLTHRLILISDLPDDLVRSLGAEPACDMEEAFRLARQSVPRAATGWIVGQGSKILIEPTPQA